MEHGDIPGRVLRGTKLSLKEFLDKPNWSSLSLVELNSGSTILGLILTAKDSISTKHLERLLLSTASCNKVSFVDSHYAVLLFDNSEDLNQVGHYSVTINNGRRKRVFKNHA